MIKSFRHKGIKVFYETGSTRGIQAAHAKKLAKQLLRLSTASEPKNMDVPGWFLHPLHGKNPQGQEVEGHWSVWVNANWRMTFTFENGDAVLLDYQDYH